MNNCTKLLAYLDNMEEVIKNEDKTLISLSLLPDDEYEIFVLTLINCKHLISYNEVSTVLVNHDQGRRTRCPASTEVLTIRGRSYT